MKNEDILKTLDVLALACVVGSYAFGAPWLLAAAAALLVLNLLGGRIPYLIAAGWKNFSLLLGSINTRIILSLFFYLMLTPFALLYRVFNRKAVDDFSAKGKNTLFRDVQSPITKGSFKKLW